MAVDALLWRAKACEVVSYVADEHFQRSAWFGKGPYISSPDEVYNSVFSDLNFEKFIDSPEVGLTDLQKAAATDLINKMNDFDRMTGGNLSPSKVIDDPKWREVREVAQRFLIALGCPSAWNSEDTTSNSSKQA